MLAQIDRVHDHAGCAKAALQAVAFFERCLHGMHRTVGRSDTLDGGDGRSSDLPEQHIARLHGIAVDVHGAGAALSGIATDVGAGEFKMFAQGLHVIKAAN